MRKLVEIDLPPEHWRMLEKLYAEDDGVEALSGVVSSVLRLVIEDDVAEERKTAA